MKRLYIEWLLSYKATYVLVGFSPEEWRGVIEVDRFMDCFQDVVHAVYDKLEEDDIKLVGKCEVYFNGKLWETVDNG